MTKKEIHKLIVENNKLKSDIVFTAKQVRDRDRLIDVLIEIVNPKYY